MSAVVQTVAPAASPVRCRSRSPHADQRRLIMTGPRVHRVRAGRSRARLMPSGRAASDDVQLKPLIGPRPPPRPGEDACPLC